MRRSEFYDNMGLKKEDSDKVRIIFGQMEQMVIEKSDKKRFGISKWNFWTQIKFMYFRQKYSFKKSYFATV